MIDALRCPYAKPFDSIISKRCSVKNIAGAHGVERFLPLLLLFPIWLEAYVGGVVCNSDGADLTVYWYSMPGIWVWGVVFAARTLGCYLRGFGNRFERRNCLSLIHFTWNT